MIGGMSTAASHHDLAWDLPDRLAKSMRVSGLRSSALGDQLGVSRNTIANYLAGRTAPDRRTLIAWAFATGVPLTWLETGQAQTDNPPGPGTSYTARDSNPEPTDVCTILRAVA